MPHDLTMADADPSPTRKDEPSTLYPPVLGRVVAPLPSSSKGHASPVVTHGSHCPSDRHDPARPNASQTVTPRILRGDGLLLQVPWCGKRRRSPSPPREGCDDGAATKKHCGSDCYSYRPAPRRARHAAAKFA